MQSNIYNIIIQYLISEVPNRFVKPYGEIFKSRSDKIQPNQIIPIIDKLESDGLIQTLPGHGNEYKKIRLTPDSINKLIIENNLSDEEKIHAILEYIVKTNEENSRKNSFETDEIQKKLFVEELLLPINVQEVNYLVQQLINDEIVIDASSKDNQGTLTILTKRETAPAYYGQKYLKLIEPTRNEQIINIENIQSNTGIIQGNQVLTTKSKNVDHPNNNKGKIIGIVSLILTIIGVALAIIFEIF